MSQNRTSKRCFAGIMVILIGIAALWISGCADQTDRKRPYLLLYAFEAEGVLLSQEMTIRDSVKALGRKVYLGSLSGKDIILAESGIGMTNAAMTAQLMTANYNPRAIIFSGIAGAVDTSVRIGDIVVCRQWKTHDYGYHGKNGFQVNGIKVYNPELDSVTKTYQFEVDGAMYKIAEGLSETGISLLKIGDREPLLSAGGTGVSGNCFIDSHEKRLWLSDQFDALITDMESAAVGQVAMVNNVPFIVFRSASDLAGGSGSETAHDELEKFFKIAADNSSRVVIEFLSGL
jgi:adenosylhomocysteine nucleosidase